VHVVEIDVIGLEPFQRGVDIAADGFGRTVDAAVLSLDHDAGLGREAVFPAPVPQSLADQRLIMTETVDIGGVEMIIAQVERAVEQRQASASSGIVP
jgi:hypothetical protein